MVTGVISDTTGWYMEIQNGVFACDISIYSRMKFRGEGKSTISSIFMSSKQKKSTSAEKAGVVVGARCL